MMTCQMLVTVAHTTIEVHALLYYPTLCGSLVGFCNYLKTKGSDDSSNPTKSP